MAAAVSPSADGELTADGLVAHVARRLAGYEKPRTVVFVPDVRRSPSGKPDLRPAQDVAENG